jgi:tryptophan 7-halogenase
MSRGLLRNIVIVGGGTAGWMTAAALSRFLETGYTITLVESDAIGTVGVGEATIPMIRLFNDALGIDEADFLCATSGTYKLGIEFVGWGGEGLGPDHRYMHAFGPVGRPLGLVPFHHYWLRAGGTHLGTYSLNETAARAGKFAHVSPQPGSPVPDMPYAFHFDAGLYAAFLRKYAEARHVRRIEGRIGQVDLDPETGHVKSIAVNGLDCVEGDMFIDCSGFRGLLIEEALSTGYDDWTHWLPCDRAMAVPCESTPGGLAPYTRATARAAGWQWRIPLQHRTGNGYVYASAHLSDDEAATNLLANLDGKALADPKPLRFTTGARRKFLNKNVVAIGLASGFMEPLESTSIHLIQTAISRLLSFLPAVSLGAAEEAEYNRQTRVEYERIRDFLILHYHANGRDEPLWRACRAITLPDSLTEKLNLWREGARIHRRDEELFTQDGWVQVLIGQGIVPASQHPLAAQLSDAERAGFLTSVRDIATRSSAQMPDHAAYLARFCGSASSPMKAVA